MASRQSFGKRQEGARSAPREALRALAREPALKVERRRGPLESFLFLYTGDATYRGFVDFAAIGAIVIAFMNPYALFNWSLPSQFTFTSPTNGPVGAGPLPSPMSALRIDTTAFASSTPEVAEQLKTAVQAYDKEDFDGVLDALKDADQNDPNVQLMRGIGTITAKGGVEAYFTSVKLLEAALRASKTQARVWLARVLIFAAPPGVIKDRERARRLLETSADAGDADAAYHLALAYKEGGWLDLDMDRSVRYLKMASSRGQHDAQIVLAFCYARGVGVEQNIPKAEELLTIAARAGHVVGKYLLGKFYLQRWQGGWMSDLGEAVVWLSEAANAGSTDAMFDLAMIRLEYAKAPPLRDLVRGVLYMKRCADLWNENCILAYAKLADEGRGVAQNPSEARLYYDLAKRLGKRGLEPQIEALDTRLTIVEINDLEKRADAMLATRLRPKVKPVVNQ